MVLLLMGHWLVILKSLNFYRNKCRHFKLSTKISSWLHSVRVKLSCISTFLKSKTKKYNPEIPKNNKYFIKRLSSPLKAHGFICKWSKWPIIQFFGKKVRQFFKSLFSKRSLCNLVSGGKHDIFLHCTSETEKKALTQRKLSLQQVEDKRHRRYYLPSGKEKKDL